VARKFLSIGELVAWNACSDAREHFMRKFGDKATVLSDRGTA
jgi:hypothetical protein